LNDQYSTFLEIYFLLLLKNERCSTAYPNSRPCIFHKITKLLTYKLGFYCVQNQRYAKKRYSRQAKEY